MLILRLFAGLQRNTMSIFMIALRLDDIGPFHESSDVLIAKSHSFFIKRRSAWDRGNSEEFVLLFFQLPLSDKVWDQIPTASAKICFYQVGGGVNEISWDQLGLSFLTQQRGGCWKENCEISWYILTFRSCITWILKSFYRVEGLSMRGEFKPSLFLHHQLGK